MNTHLICLIIHGYFTWAIIAAWTNELQYVCVSAQATTNSPVLVKSRIGLYLPFIAKRTYPYAVDRDTNCFSLTLQDVLL